MIKKGVVADIAILCNHLPGGLLPDRVLVHTGDRNEVVSFLLKQKKEKTIKQLLPLLKTAAKVTNLSHDLFIFALIKLEYYGTTSQLYPSYRNPRTMGTF